MLCFLSAEEDKKSSCLSVVKNAIAVKLSSIGKKSCFLSVVSVQASL